MEISVTLSANAGVAICTDSCRIWVDAIHNRKEPGFSTVTPDLQQKMLKHDAFRDPEHILFTHCHPDHYSHSLAAAASKLWPNARLYLPEQVFPGQVLISGQSCNLSRDVTVSFIKLPHEGAQYAQVLHYGAIIRIRGKNLLVAGDCATASQVLAKVLAEEKIHLAVLNFPWITLKKGRAFLQENLPNAKLLICHLPFAEDDINGYRQAARKAAAECPNVRLLSEPLQTETVNI